MVALVFNHLLQDLLLITLAAAVELSELLLLVLEDLAVEVTALKEFPEELLQLLALQTQAVAVEVALVCHRYRITVAMAAQVL
jgi:hypothetical protein